LKKRRKERAFCSYLGGRERGKKEKSSYHPLVVTRDHDGMWHGHGSK